MLKDLITALKMSFFTLLLTGVIYPLLIMGFSYVFFYKKATGSLVYNEQKKIIGSELIGQKFQHPAYFFPRPSEAGKGYDGAHSKGSNLAPTSIKLVEKIHERATILGKMNTAPIPIDLITSSASGLDPHISPQAAYWQAPYIALQRDVSLKRIMSIIDEQTKNSQFYILGNPYINVLKLNLALDQFFGSPQESR